MPNPLPVGQSRNPGLVDLLDRILDKGLVIAGDIKVSLAEVELITIRIRLLVCSLDKAQEIGLDWWKYDRYLSPGGHQAVLENESLRQQVQALERKVAELSGSPPSPSHPNPPHRAGVRDGDPGHAAAALGTPARRRRSGEASREGGRGHK